MIAFTRPAPIPEIEDNWVRWTEYFQRRKAKNNAARFYWPRYPNAKGEPVNRLIAQTLFEATGWHCAYCDRFPLFKHDETIDHFRPKGAYPHLAYRWDNLFPVCDACQSMKMEQFDDLLLKPDEAEFDFHRYFIFDYTTFELKPNPMALPQDQDRARATIELLGLGHRAHCTSRRHHHQRYYSGPDPTPADYAYRYMFQL